MNSPVRNSLSGQTFKGVASTHGFKIVAFRGEERTRAGAPVADLTQEQINAHGIGHGNPIEVRLSNEAGGLRVCEILNVTKSDRQLAEETQEGPVAALR